jgi:hypothetical protein
MQPKASKNAFLILMKALSDADQYGRRHDYSFRHSNGRTESTKELTDRECYAIVAELVERYGITVTADPANEKRRKMIAMAHGMGWKIGAKADIKRLDDWCLEKGPFKKPLKDHSVTDLSKAISAFDSMYRKYMNKQ